MNMIEGTSYLNFFEEKTFKNDTVWFWHSAAWHTTAVSKLNASMLATGFNH